MSTELSKMRKEYEAGALEAVPRKATAHRALDDIRESIEELRYYREHLFVPAESSATLEASYSNITALIEQETGKKVVFQNASDYAAVIEIDRHGDALKLTGRLARQCVEQGMEPASAWAPGFWASHWPCRWVCSYFSDHLSPLWEPWRPAL